MGVLQKKKSKTATVRRFFFLVFPSCHHAVSFINCQESMSTAQRPFVRICQKYSIRNVSPSIWKAFCLLFKKGELVC